MTSPKISGIQGRSEYDPLQWVILCPPKFMRIEEVINRTQRKFAEENIDSEIAGKQHQAFIRVLERNNIEVTLLRPEEEYPEQVFTRDIAFVIGRRLFLSNMNKDIRNGEVHILKEHLKEENIPFTELREGSIEGGDVIVDGKKVWLGISGRTDHSVVDELKSYCRNYEIHPLPFAEEYLHLDCVFNVISPEEALIYPPAFARREYEKLAAAYDLIQVKENEQSTLGANVLTIGNRTIISSGVNRDTNRELERHGYKVIKVDIAEILKSGGSLRCITLPLFRK